MLSDEVLQILVWLAALLELIMALYVLILNSKRSANRYMSLLLLTFAGGSFGLGLLLQTTIVDLSFVATVCLSLTVEPVKVGLLLVVVVSLKPVWLQGRWRWAGRLLYIWFALPIVLTFIDVLWGTQLWFTPLGPGVYTRGYIPGDLYMGGAVANVVRPFYTYVLSLLPLVPLFYLSWWDSETTGPTRQLAHLLLAGQIAAIFVQLGLRPLIGPIAATTITTVLFAGIYTYTAFQQMVHEGSVIHEHQVQEGRLQFRLTALVMVIALPILIAGIAIIIFQVLDDTLLSTDDALQVNTNALLVSTDAWLDANAGFLQQLVQQPQIISMDATQQKPLLQAMTGLRSHIRAVSTVDLTGMPIARSDSKPLESVARREWFESFKLGVAIVYQSVQRADGAPAVVIAMPIRDTTDGIVGVAMLDCDLPALVDVLAIPADEKSTVAYVIDANDNIVAHTQVAYTNNLQSFKNYPPVRAWREGAFSEKEPFSEKGALSGIFEFTDRSGDAWKAYGLELDNGWAAFTQVNADVFFALVRRLGRAAIGILGIGAFLLGLLLFLTMQYSFRPINTLIQVAAAISAGDLSRTVPVQSNDELGVLARTFNEMTLQLRESIDLLEQRVLERTQDLERHAAYLVASSEIGRAVASILDAEDLMRRVVELVRERFELYYVGLFVLDAGGEWAVLQSGTGAAGRMMLARGYRIYIEGRVASGAVAWCVAHKQMRVASRAEVDTVRATIAEWSDMRSELALPLMSRGRILGVVDVYSKFLNTFDADTLTILQTVADQIAVALDNARLFAEAQEALEAERRAYGTRARESWFDLTRSRDDWGYRCMQRRAAEPVLTPAVGDWPADMRDAHHSGKNVLGTYVDSSVLAIPIKTSDAVVGVLRFERSEEDAVWSSEEVSLLEALTEQLAQTLERAQLYQETQRRALREQLAREVTDKMRRTLSWDELMQVAIQEMGTALHASRSFVQWVPSAQSLGADDAGGGNG